MNFVAAWITLKRPSAHAGAAGKQNPDQPAPFIEHDRLIGAPSCGMEKRGRRTLARGTS